MLPISSIRPASDMSRNAPRPLGFPEITVDTFLPFSRLNDLLKWYAVDFGRFAVRVVPYARLHHSDWLGERFSAGLDHQLIVDIPIYGMKQRGDANYLRSMDEKLQELNAIKTPISYNS